MFSKLLGFFRGESSLPQSIKASLGTDKEGNPSDRDLHVAVVVLLVEMAGADKEILRPEAQEVCFLVQQQFDLDEKEIPTLVETAVAARKTKGKIDEFVSYINQKFDDAQKTTLLAMIWKVVMADGKVDKYEERLATQLRVRLQLSEEANQDARHMAETGEV